MPWRSDLVTVSDAVRLSITTGTRSMRIARREGKAYVWIPLVVALVFVAAAWLHGRSWLAPAGVVMAVLMVYAPPLLGCLLARSGVGGRVLLYESNQHGRGRVTIRVQRRGLLHRGPRYVLLWNLASALAPGQDPPERATRPGRVVMNRAITMAQAAGLDLRLQATNRKLADTYYAPMGFVLEQPRRPGSTPWMVLR